VVAVVDDDPSVGKALRRLLTVLGYHVELFGSAAHFMSAIITLDAVCLIVDIDLGDSSGLDLARRLAADGVEFPIIFMTGCQGDRIHAECLDFGCAAFLRKPFSDDQLVDALAKAIPARLRVE
jgi:FixJ family two-component response regulator